MKWFRRSEFACNCGCGFDTVDFELVEILDKIRSYFEKPVTITSGCRCLKWNTAQGGSNGSQHMLGRAADIKISGIDPQVVAEAAGHFGATGIKSYRTFTHIDTRSGAPWLREA